MNHPTSKIAAAATVILLAAGAGVQALNAQPAPAVKRTILLKQEMTIPGREAVMAVVELPPGSAEGRHSHPAEVFAIMLEGTISLEVEGKPTATLKAGEIFYIAPGSVHQAVNNSTAPAKLEAVFVAEKGKPLTTPAP
ncbi:MAG TPA: cupin domain-containing protein [Thermoanaerobaculia bacterium]|nr:cupin domain-containing protein [Thermoanaerobaculia bacterium]